MVAGDKKLTWYFDPATFELVGKHRDKEGGKYQFKIVEAENGYHVTGGARTDQGNINFDLGYIQGSDAEKKGQSLSEFILGTILKEGVKRFMGFGDLAVSVEKGDTDEERGTGETGQGEKESSQG